MDKVRIGLIGTSWWADWMYMPAIRSHAGADLVAVCGTSAERTAAFAAKHGIPSHYSDWRQMFAAGGLDAVIVAVPDDAHKAIVLGAFDAGLHVLCEKPLALNAADADAMAQAATASGRIHLVLFTWRWQPPFQYARRLIGEGYVGKPLKAQFSFESGGAHDRNYQWRQDGTHGTGVLGDLGSHMVDMSEWLIGPIAQVSAHAPVMIDRSGFDGKTPKPVNDTAHLTMEFANGAQGVIDVTALARLGDTIIRIGTRIDGEDGSIEIDYRPLGPHPLAEVRGVRAGEQSFAVLPIPADLLPTKPEDPLAVFTEKSVGTRLFIESVLGKVTAVPGFETGARVQHVIDAAFRSHEQRRWVDVA
jgi:predicted dehydrogenase